MPKDPTRRLAWAVTLSALVGFVVVAAVVVPWRWLPDLGTWTAVAPGDLFPAHRLDQLDAFSGQQRLLRWLGIGIGLGWALILGLTDWGARLIGILPSRFRLLSAVAVLCLLGQIVVLPFGWLSYRNAVAVGLSNQSIASWWQDQGVDWLVTTVMTAIGVGAIVLLARRLPRTWPVWGAVAAMVMVMAGSFAYPVVIEPLFNTFTPLRDQSLRHDITQIADREGVHVDEVLVADASRRTTALNAYVSGFGSTRRVVLYDTLLDSIPRAQIDVVVAHELAHARHRDVVTMTALAALGSAMGVGLLALLLGPNGRLLRRSGARAVADVAVIPVVMALMAAGAFVSAPAQNLISRAVEARADVGSLTATHAYDAFTAMQVQLCDRAWADPDPPAWSQWWLGSHPTAVQRVGMADYLRERAARP